MRNLKRVLSLTLASVMLLGMMVVGASAVDYPDVDALSDNIEAIEVTSAIGIFEGDDNGEFRPGDEVTRAEMAKIMSELLGLDYQHFEGLHPFTDTVGHWAEAYIAACSANGVINGRGGGIYDPSATVTAVEASAMLMRAMGYFKYASDVAEGFDIATIAQANKIGLYTSIDSSVYSGMPRGDVAQLVLNALQCSMVEVNSVATTVTTPDGTVVSTGRTEYIARRVEDINGANAGTSRFKYDKISNATTATNVYTMELGEEMYDGKLELVTTGQTDAFGRPANVWKYNNKEIGTYNDTPDLVYTKAVKGKDIWADLGKPTAPSSFGSGHLDTYYYIDGDTTANAGSRYMAVSDPAYKYSVDTDGSENVYGSGKGVETTVYFDPDTYQVKIYTVQTFLAEVTGDYDAEDDSLAIEVKGDYNFETELDGEKFAISGYENGDYLCVTAAKNGSTYEIQSVSPATVVSGVTIDEYKTSSSGGGSIVTGDSKSYDFNYTVSTNSNAVGYALVRGNSKYDMDGGEYDLYLDQYGYVIGIDGVSSGNSIDDYLFVSGVADELGGTYKAYAYFMDGTSKIIMVSKVGPRTGTNIDKPYTLAKDVNPNIIGDIGAGVLAAGMFYSFKVDKNGDYELTSAGAQNAYQGRIKSPTTPMPADTSYKIDPDAGSSLKPFVYEKKNGSGAVTISTYPVSSDTVFITRDEVYVGVKNTPTVAWYTSKSDTVPPAKNVYYMLDKDTQSYMVAVYIDAEGEGASSKAEDWFYIYDVGNTTKDYVNYSAVQGTEKVTLKVDTDGQPASGRTPGLYKVTSYTSDGYAKVGDTPGDTYVVAKDSVTGDAKNSGNRVYAVSVDAGNGEVALKAGILSITSGVTATYYLGEDAEIYRINANDSGKSVTSSSKITVKDVENIKSGKYDIYLIVDKDDASIIELIYFVRKSS